MDSSRFRDATLLTLSHSPSALNQYRVAANGNPTSYTFAGISMQAPWRVFPGKLSVSRTIGDLEAKSQKFGGNPNVVISEPDITQFKIRSDYDFIILACKSQS